MTYADIMNNYEGFFVVASVTEREESGKAKDFTVLSKSTKKQEATESYEYFASFSEDVLLLPVFNKTQVSFGMIGAEGTTVLEPLMSAQEDARFFRTYMGQN